MSRPLQRVIKEYPRRGSIQQFRLESAVSFACFRCQQAKKSKLMTVYRGNWDRVLCNGCYGRLLSLYDVAAGTEQDDAKAAQLSEMLVQLVSEEEARRGLALNRIAAGRTEHLSNPAKRFLGTGEFIAQILEGRTDLDWSAAILGLCKAVEAEFIARVIEPLRAAPLDLSEDITDPQLGRVARYCSGIQEAPPELGAIRMLLDTAAHSKSRLHSSPLLGLLKAAFADWPHAGWLTAEPGAPSALNELTAVYRNRAAHLGELGAAEYNACFELVAGDNGILWNLITATSTRRQTAEA